MSDKRRIAINPRGYWETTDGAGHVFDQDLARSLLHFLQKRKVDALYDFGCGMADYHKVFEAQGITSLAYDGNPNTPILTEGRAKVLDLSKPVDLGRKLRCVLSLEVGEHIPKEYETTFIENVARHSNRFVILSWAVPGQIGDGHVNCQTNEYIIHKLKERGFSFLEEDSIQLRMGSSAAWFKNTIMVFKKKFSWQNIFDI